MHQHFQSAQGVCPKCRGEGRVGQRCEHGACARDGIHYIPTRFAPQRGDERDPLLGHVVARHLLIERLQRRVIDTAYRALQIPALLEVELTLDSVTGQTIISLMKDLNQRHETTFIFSTHDQHVMTHARRLVQIADGVATDLGLAPQPDSPRLTVVA